MELSQLAACNEFDTLNIHRLLAETELASLKSKQIWHKKINIPIERINNDWFLILENITRGYGNHK